MLRRSILLAACALALAACSTPTSEAEPAAPLTTTGVLAEAASGGPALTYDPAAAPVGATMALEVVPGEGSTTARLRVERMAP